jgi:hypothetical protein
LRRFGDEESVPSLAIVTGPRSAHSLSMLAARPCMWDAPLLTKASSHYSKRNEKPFESKRRPYAKTAV